MLDNLNANTACVLCYSYRYKFQQLIIQHTIQSLGRVEGEADGITRIVQPM